MTRLSQNAALNELARQCVDEGWTVELTAGGHLRWTAPNGGFVFSASTPGDQRVYRNHIALLKRAWPEWRPVVKRDEDKPRRNRPKAKLVRGRIYAGASKGPWNPAQIPYAQSPTLAAVWPEERDDLIIPKPPSLW